MDLDEDLSARWSDTDIVLLGGSAGSFKLIFQIIKNLTNNFNRSVIIIIHRKKNFVSELEKLFGEHSKMPVREIHDKDKIETNTIYIAPANYHTLIEKSGHFALDVSENVWYSKPSIDVTFENAAEIFGNRCAAILFSGANADGADGLLKLRKAGALTIVQDPEDAEMPEMPQTAVNLNAANYVLKVSEILELLKK